MTQDTVTMDSDDESSVSLLSSRGGGGYVPSTLEQHSRKRTTPTTHTIDLKKLGMNITLSSNVTIYSNTIYRNIGRI